MGEPDGTGDLTVAAMDEIDETDKAMETSRERDQQGWTEKPGLEDDSEVEYEAATIDDMGESHDKDEEAATMETTRSHPKEDWLVIPRRQSLSGMQAPYCFIYRRLSSPDSTRLLIVSESNDRDSEICCRLAEVRLSEVRDGHNGYTALSYVWGTQDRTCEIWIGAHKCLINPNLESALLHLRRRDRPIRLWIDALCINQTDLLERNQQVQQMRSIYAAASETVIYLGAQDGGNTGLSAWNFLERHSSWAWNDHQDRDHTIAAGLEELDSFRGELRDVELDVLSRPWFRRLWVFQEAVVSRDLSIQCGSRRVAWDDFCATVLLSPKFHDQYGFSLLHLDNADIVRDIALSRSEYLLSQGLHQYLPSWKIPKALDTSSDGLTILRLLARTRYLQASDARDKIFGLLGIATDIDVSDPGFAIDYRVHYYELYVRFAKHIIKTMRSYDIISYANSAAESILPGPYLPSWVPNWDYEDIVSYGSDRTILETLRAETPTQKQARRSRVVTSWSTENNYLGLVSPGRIIGQIEEYTLPLRLSGLDEVAFEAERVSTGQGDDTFHPIMTLWAEKFFFSPFDRGSDSGDASTGDDNSSKERRRPIYIASPGGRSLAAVKSPLRARRYSSHLDRARMQDRRSVEHHLHARGRQTASWSDGNNKAVVPIIDGESVVDGKRLAICITTGPPFEQLALVPELAQVGDLIVQLSGSRVPYVVRPHGSRYWPDEIANMSWMFVEGPTVKTVRCRLVGECVLNGFEELPEDSMRVAVAMF